MKIQLFLAAAVAVALSSCQSCGNLGNLNVKHSLTNYIPADAPAVATLDLQALMKKADWQTLSQLDFFQRAIGRTDAQSGVVAQLFQDPTALGIDLSKNAYLFFNSTSPDDVGGMMFAVADRAALEETMRRANAPMQQTADYAYTPLGDKLYFAWNDAVAMLVNTNDSLPVAAQLAAALQPKTENLRTDNAHFSVKKVNGHDLSFWVNTEKIGEQIYERNKSALMLAEISKEAMAGNTFYTHLDFEEGKMTATSEYDLHPDLLNNAKMVFGKKVTTDFSPYLPADDLALVVTSALDLKGLNQLLKEKPAAATGLELMNNININPDDIAKAFGKDMAIAMYNNSDKGVPQAMVVLQVADRVAFDALMSKAIADQLFEDLGNGTYSLFEAQGNELLLMEKDGKVFISSHEVVMDRLRDKGSIAKADRLPQATASNMQQGFMSIWVNPAENPLSNALGDAQIANIQSNAGWKKATTVVTFKDPTTNSLRQLIQAAANRPVATDTTKVQ